VLNLWALQRNGWANEYYSAAVRSMSSSWHALLYGSFDQSGVMTVDKPPLALWVQVAFVKAFGYHPLSMLVPQALIGVASVALVYDVVLRRFGRAAGFVAGLALATTPITVAISRHNNPDGLLVLCWVGGDSTALAAALRYVRSHGGGAIAVSSQQGASQTIISTGADVAALGGFSGRETEVSVAWLADAVRAGKLRWVLTDDAGGASPATGAPAAAR
jgi:Dolichyl-phosphate-mannose-protein mannosyltransferase